ncbi:hypothetical protein [Mesorhizobium sp.]|uniref:hypothetical protein n=1 Tax=Mesorhizobium sp. TaxID=1871066 RepID=UPI000FE50B80|nr:hypothetical protein [Mesorhizobium sp.]RWQ28342.1 MAG: hypothetical protein EOS19_15560 [Mesorhizobium sp.]
MSADDPDDTKNILAQLLAELHAKQAANPTGRTGSYLMGGDDVFLGNINNDPYDRDSFKNPYGPYGSPYSQTSIFNLYSPYRSPYGAYSLANPYTLNPPKLFLDGKYRGQVTANPRIADRIRPEPFLEALENNIGSIIDGSFLQKAERQARGDTYIEADDGTFLGTLNPNQYDQESIFNSYGPFGSRYSPTSIHNTYGTYGGNYSAQSPYNQFTRTPPKLFHRGKLWGSVTKNRYAQGKKVDPDDLGTWIASNGYSPR